MIRKILESILIGMAVFAIMFAFGFEKSTAITYEVVPEVEEPVVEVIVKEKVIYKTYSDFSEDEVYMLAQCIEAEAGINNEQSQKYITQVILNRLHSDKFPDSLEEVIYQKIVDIPQFCVAYNGRMEREVKPSTLATVYKVLAHGTDLPENVLYFYAESVEGNWVNTLPIYDSVQGTIFAYDK